MILRRSSYRYLLRRPLLLVLSILGVALGVAVVVAIDLANSSAERAFRLSAQALAGRATHQVAGGPEGLDESVYVRLRREVGVRAAAPVVEGYAGVPAVSGLTLQVLGIDPFAEEPFRTYAPAAGRGGDIGRLMTEPGAALLLPATAERLGLEPGDRLEIEVGGVRRTLTLAGTLVPGDEIAAGALENMVVTDIATAQELFGQMGALSRIDLAIPEGTEGEALLARIREVLPPQAAVIPAESRGDFMARMTRAFQLNLTALSLLALVVGMFLIYNTLSFAVLQRRELLGSLRTLGATRREIFRLIIGEALLLGGAGTLLGLFLGMALGSGLLHLVTRTINDLYFVLAVREPAITPWSLAKGVALGLGASVLAALAPAREAAGAPPRTVLARSVLEGRHRRLSPVAAGAGALLIALGGAVLLLTERSIPLAFGALFAVIAGYALIVPWAASVLLRLIQPLARGVFGLLGKMGTRFLLASLSRTGVAMAALVVAVSAAIGVGIMIGSFRLTLDRWMESYLQADIYVTVAGRTAESRIPLAPEVVEELSRLPEVELATRARHVQLASAEGWIDLMAVDMPRRSFAGYDLRTGDREEVRRLLHEMPAVLASEPYAWRHGLREGETVRLRTDRGEVDFVVAGIFTDYSTDRGRLVMSLPLFERFWRYREIDALGLFLTPGDDAERAVEAARRTVGDRQQVMLYSNAALREASMATFDRTFAITSVLRLLAVLIAFVGILSALLSIQIERGRELAVLRANGLTPGQLWALVTGETALIGLLSGLLAIPLGILQAQVLIHVINRRSFGWTLQTFLDPYILLQAVGLALAAALLAGLYPSWRMARTSPALALREE